MFRTTFLGMVILATASCGGSSVGVPSFDYTGLTTPASFTVENGLEIAKYSCLVQHYSKTMTAWIDAVRNTTRLPGTHEGDCGGTLTIRGDLSSGSVKFNDYCTDDYEVIHVTGEVRVWLNQNLRISMELNNLRSSITGSNFGYSFTTHGNVVDNGLDVSANYIMRDDQTGIVYKQENFKFFNRDVTGRIYHPKYGYFDVSTPILVGNRFGRFYSGVIRFDGENSTVFVNLSSDIISLRTPTVSSELATALEARCY